MAPMKYTVTKEDILLGLALKSFRIDKNTP